LAECRVEHLGCPLAVAALVSCLEHAREPVAGARQKRMTAEGMLERERGVEVRFGVVVSAEDRLELCDCACGRAFAAGSAVWHEQLAVVRHDERAQYRGPRLVAEVRTEVDELTQRQWPTLSVAQRREVVVRE